MLVNGKQTRTIRPSRGLRQGDPLPLYLFILVVDVLSRMMENQVARGQVHGIKPKGTCPIIHHLFFVDDSLFFMSGTVEKARTLRGVIDNYCHLSGQKVNYAKSSVFFNKATDSNFRQEVTHTLGVQQVLDPGQYLGLPSVWGRSRRYALAYLKERVKAKINSWRNRLLTNAGKEVLIKSVITAIPTYVMSILKIPQSWCTEVNALIAKFWWAASNEDRKIHWKRWDMMTKSKGQGDFGFRELQGFNSAMLTNMAARVLDELNSLWVQVLRGIYFSQSDFMQASWGVDLREVGPT